MDAVLNLPIGIIIVFVASFIFYKNYKWSISLKKTGIRTTGIVLSIETEYGSGEDDSNIQVPVTRFVTKDGIWITGKNQGINYTFSPFREGEIVSVYYDSNNPKEFIIEKEKDSPG